jgi:hypothetical protein
VGVGVVLSSWYMYLCVAEQLPSRVHVCLATAVCSSRVRVGASLKRYSTVSEAFLRPIVATYTYTLQ